MQEGLWKLFTPNPELAEGIVYGNVLEQLKARAVKYLAELESVGDSPRGDGKARSAWETKRETIDDMFLKEAMDLLGLELSFGNITTGKD